MVNSQPTDFLNSQEKYIFEEIKFIQKIMADSESAYANWENWFIAIQALLMAAVAQILSKSDLHPIIIIIEGLGMFLSLLFSCIQYGNRINVKARGERWKKLETLLSKELSKNSITFMAILGDQEKEKEQYWWNRFWFKRVFATYSMRIYVPLLFLLAWIGFFYFTVGRLYICCY